MAWQPDNRQWILIASAFAVAAFAFLFPADLSVQWRYALKVAAVAVTAGVLVLSWLQGKRRT